jgi:hypothetical protein
VSITLGDIATEIDGSSRLEGDVASIEIARPVGLAGCVHVRDGNLSHDETRVRGPWSQAARETRLSSFTGDEKCAMKMGKDRLSIN